jgi:hypothetical protein
LLGDTSAAATTTRERIEAFLQRNVDGDAADEYYLKRLSIAVDEDGGGGDGSGRGGGSMSSDAKMLAMQATMTQKRMHQTSLRKARLVQHRMRKTQLSATAGGIAARRARIGSTASTTSEAVAVVGVESAVAAASARRSMKNEAARRAAAAAERNILLRESGARIEAQETELAYLREQLQQLADVDNAYFATVTPSTSAAAGPLLGGGSAADQTPLASVSVSPSPSFRFAAERPRTARSAVRGRHAAPRRLVPAAAAGAAGGSASANSARGALQTRPSTAH